MRFARALSLILVFCLASTFTLACAFACEDPAAPAASSHCHQAGAKAAEPAPVGTPSFSKASAECPMLEEMQGRKASLSASAAAKVSVQPHSFLPLETAILVTAKAPVRPAAQVISAPSLPLYLKKRALRL